ncbi:MAG: VOC family protein [Deltaproteobacteria bacterium]|nr:VOC family protein [Deltaproteobacteria bacterium]
MSGTRRVFASTPLLVVRDLRASAAFYEKVLGYEEPGFWGEPPVFCMLHRDEHDLMLSLAESPEQVRPNGPACRWDVHLRVADLDAERAAIVAAGVTPVEETASTPYGMRELVVADPDGHWICLGQDVEMREEDRGK